MPVYNFHCGDCGEFHLLRTIAERNEPATCPECAQTAVRTITAPNLALMNPITRRAVSINERSRHEPRVSNKGGHSCGTGCGCGSPIKKARVQKTKLGDLQAQKRTARPWMLGH